VWLLDGVSKRWLRMFVEDLFFLIQGHFVPVRKTVFVTEGFIIIL
jgi:hypothetical protein